LKSVYNENSNTYILKPTPKNTAETLKQYVDTVARLHLAMGDEFTGEISFLYNVEGVKQFIYENYDKSNTRIHYLKSIVGLLRRMMPLDTFKEIADIYSQMMMDEKKIYDTKSGDNKLTQKEAKNYLDWSDITNMDTSNLTPTDDLIFNLYTSIPPRRNLDYSVMKLIKNVSKTEMEKLPSNFNYLVVNNNKPCCLIYNNYKTKKNYGKFIIDLDNRDMALSAYMNIPKLNKSIKNFINNTDINSGDLLFTSSNGNSYKDWSTRLYSVFKNLGRKISCNILRHSFLTDFYNQKNISVNTIKKISQYMAHSPMESLKYRRFKDESDKKNFEKQIILKD
jgi:hypothetical protein